MDRRHTNHYLEHFAWQLHSNWYTGILLTLVIPIVNTTHLVSWTSDKRTHVKAQYCTFIADILISKSMSNFNTCYLYYQNYVLDFLWFAYLTSPCCTWRPIEQRLRINISITCTYLSLIFLNDITSFQKSLLIHVFSFR